jgi:2'-5' RNA ligase
MANLALIYPNISKEDFETIQTIRKEHDPKYFDVVDPHITLVFSTDKITADELVEHVKTKLSGMGTFSIEFESAKVVENDAKDFYHAFLIPSIGFDQINAVHDLLYTGVLESELRHDIPFIPHLGIGTGTKQEMEALVSRLNESKISIAGKADTVAIVQYDGSKVSKYASVSLV